MLSLKYHLIYIVFGSELTTKNLIHFFNCGTRVACSLGHAIWISVVHPTSRCSTLLVELGNDWVADCLHLLLLVLELLHLGQLVAVQPFQGLVTLATDRSLLVLRDLLLQILFVHA